MWNTLPFRLRFSILIGCTGVSGAGHPRGLRILCQSLLSQACHGQFSVCFWAGIICVLPYTPWRPGRLVKVGDFYKGPLLHNTFNFNLYNVPYVNMWTIKDENFIIKHTFVNFIKLAYWQSGTQLFHFLTLKSALRHHVTDNKFENI